MNLYSLRVSRAMGELWKAAILKNILSCALEAVQTSKVRASDSMLKVRILHIHPMASKFKNHLYVLSWFLFTFQKNIPS